MGSSPLAHPLYTVKVITVVFVFLCLCFAGLSCGLRKIKLRQYTHKYPTIIPIQSSIRLNLTNGPCLISFRAKNYNKNKVVYVRSFFMRAVVWYLGSVVTFFKAMYSLKSGIKHLCFCSMFV